MSERTEQAPGPKEWQDLDESGLGDQATAYLEATANALEDMRMRSHAALGIGAGSTVLDVGCGTGIALGELAEIVGPDGRAVGLDPSEAMLDAARQRLAEAAATTEFVVGSATATGLPDGRFDAVRTERVLMHVPDPLAAMAELARVTRPGGRIVLLEPDHRRLSIDSDDPEFIMRFTSVFGRVLANGSAGLRARSDAVLTGLRVLSAQPIPYEFESYAAFREVFDLEIGRPFMLQDGVAPERYDAFIEELEQRDTEGRFFVVGIMYLLVAEKP